MKNIKKIKIQLNGKTKFITVNTTIQTLIRDLKIPIKRETRGLPAVVKIVFATPEPMLFIAEDIPPIPTRNI